MSERSNEKFIKVILGGSHVTEIRTKVATWGELKKELSGDVRLPDPHTAILGETKSVLIDASILPDARFGSNGELLASHIFVTPVKSKSGSYDLAWAKNAGYKDLKAFIKQTRESNKDAIKFFGDYTHSSTEDLRNMVSTWIKKTGLITPQKSAPVKKEEVVEVTVAKKKFAEDLIATESPKTVGRVVNKGVIDLNNPDETLDNLIDFLTELKNRDKSSDKVSMDLSNKLLFTIEQVEAKDFDRIKRLVS
jgi:hypothetical protein